MGNAKWVKIDDTVNLIGDNIEIRNCSSQYICNVLNNQDDEIAELKEQLEKVIVPRFEKNDIVYNQVFDTSNTNTYSNGYSNHKQTTLPNSRNKLVDLNDSNIYNTILYKIYAEQLKKTNPRAYEHEYLGEITGTGGQVFANVKALNMTQEIIDTFGYVYRGLDWGFAVDPTASHGVYYDRNKKDLYIFDEIYEYGISYDQLANLIRQHNPNNMLIRADSAEPRSNSELVSRGLNVTGVKKGPGSVDHGIKWLQSLNNIFIDQVKCPNAYREFVGYEYEQTKDGNFKSSYPDKNNHAIDDVRYALEDIIQSNGVGRINIKR